MRAVNELMRNSPLLRGGAGSSKPGGLTAAGDAAALNQALQAQDSEAAAAAACAAASGRGAEAPCKFFILDVSEIAQELGLPVCNEASTHNPLLHPALFSWPLICPGTLRHRSTHGMRHKPAEGG
jgi:hypothetical protein